MFLSNNIYKQIYNKINKFETIVIARHVGPDPDALGSSLGLKQIIKDNFPNKRVYSIGKSAKRFKYLGDLDILPEDTENDKILLIVTDTPDHRRVDGVDPRNFVNSIKIDHHPFIEKTCDIEWIDDTSSSACQMILDFALNLDLKLSSEACEKLYTGIVVDTNRFLFTYTSDKTFDLIGKMLRKTDLDINKVYENLYLRNYNEIKFQGYISLNFNITESGVGYIIIDDDILKEYGVDPATPGNMINSFNYIEDFKIWLTATLDRDLGTYRVSVRSRGPIINKTLEKHGGGGHIFASGTRLKTKEDIMKLIDDLNTVSREYGVK